MAMLSDWTLVRSFLAVLRSGSLSGAARMTQLTQPTIGRHIEEMERSLKLSLFTRSPTGLTPTQTALALAPSAEAMEAALASLIRAAETGGDATAPKGTVRITASEVMGLAVLPPILSSIRRAHPGIVFELALNNRTDNLLRREADIAVRMARPAQDGLVAKKIGVLPLGLHAHRSYLERFGQPADIEALLKLHLIGFDRDDHSARSVAAGVLPIGRDIFAFRCDSDGAQMAALKAGLGVGVIQLAIARQNPDLVPVLPEAVRFQLDVWLAVHEDQRHQPAIRATFDGLADGLRDYLNVQEHPNA
jgi:DNA-binding transcriptional LysR family regulator